MPFNVLHTDTNRHKTPATEISSKLIKTNNLYTNNNNAEHVCTMVVVNTCYVTLSIRTNLISYDHYYDEKIMSVTQILVLSINLII